MTFPPTPDATPHQPAAAGRPRGERDEVVDWDAEEESAEARRGPRRLDPRARRRWWVVGTVAVVVMSALAVWFGLSATVGRVHWTDAGHQLVSGTRVDVRFDLRRDPSREVTCRLEAQDVSHAVVGRTTVAIAPSDTSPSGHVESLQTASPAITGYVDECWYTDEGPREG